LLTGLLTRLALAGLVALLALSGLSRLTALLALSKLLTLLVHIVCHETLHAKRDRNRASKFFVNSWLLVAAKDRKVGRNVQQKSERPPPREILFRAKEAVNSGTGVC
jgi:hypothetical protein